jgi:hypothetical protein
VKWLPPQASSAVAGATSSQGRTSRALTGVAGEDEVDELGVLGRQPPDHVGLLGDPVPIAQQAGAGLGEEGGGDRVAAGGDDRLVQFAVGASEVERLGGGGLRREVAPERRLEPLGHAALGDPVDRALLEHRPHLQQLLGFGRGRGGDDGAALRIELQQPLGVEPQEGLTDGSAAHPDRLRDLPLGEERPGGHQSARDRVKDGPISLVGGGAGEFKDAFERGVGREAHSITVAFKLASKGDLRHRDGA